MGAADELTKLIALRDAGEISEEEFAQQRAIILSPPSPAAAPQWPSNSGTVAPHAIRVAGGDPRLAGWGAGAQQAAKGSSRKRTALLALGVVAALVVLSSMSNRGTGSGGAAGSTPRPATPAVAAKQLVGTFVEWEPVDDSNGYAYFRIKNNGATTATAECTITVRNEFGNFGFDILVGEEVAAGETIEGRIALSVGEGSFLINEGEVIDC